MSSPLHPVATLPGLRLFTIAEEPRLWRRMDVMCSAAWPEFMLHDPVTDRHWDRLRENWPAFQVALTDESGEVVAASQAAPLRWNGLDDGLPEGWDDQFERSVADLEAGREPDALGALQIVVAPGHRGKGLSAVMLEAMRRSAVAAGLRALIACVRPTGKVQYPLLPIESYAAWRRQDGLPVDAWLRVHVRAGARIVRGAPRSMTITGSAAEWQSWTGLEFPESGPYVVAGALAPLQIDLATGSGVYLDPNIWVVHDLGR